MSNLNDFKSSGLIQKRELFTASGTWTKSSKFAGTDVWITAIGGGGSGNSANAGAGLQAGGDGGEYVTDTIAEVAALSNVTITIGVGGAAVTGADGSAGGVTSFGALVSVSGGAGGDDTATTQAIAWTGGARGGREDLNEIRSKGDTNPGVYGGHGGISTQASAQAGGGGGLVLDDSGTKAEDSINSGFAGFGYGSGGAPSATSGTVSGAGADGAILVIWMETL